MGNIKSHSQMPVIGREYPDAGENKVIAEIIKLTKTQMERIYVNSRVCRQVHAKMHGCVKAEFIVEKNLPEQLRVGIFMYGKSFPAWVRYSNGVSQIRHDKKPDTRGVAIKLMGLPGEKLLDSQKNGTTADFVLASSPFFFAKNLAQFKGLLKASVAKNDKIMVGLFFITHVKIALRAVFKILIKCKHPFEIAYYSGTPYQFGDETRAVKYHLRPSPGNKLEYTSSRHFDYLRNNMAATLNNNGVCFDFCIQFQTNAVTMPIEDATIEWKSPYIKVATLKIPAQQFDNKARDLFGDNLSYNIWNTLPEHRPLGSFNRGRKFIYQELYTFRSERNHEQLSEPVAGQDFLKPENVNQNG